VAVEDPGYPPPRLLFEARDLRVSGVPVDDEGLVVDALPPGARIVYVTPSHQYPLGITMSLARRTALLRWADDHGAAIVEDDYDSEFRFAGRPVEPLQTLDRSGRVIYVGSFSKTMLPTLRIGFIAAPPTLVEALQAAKFVTDWHTSLPTQMALAWFLEDGHFARHVRRMRGVYHQRHDVIVDAIGRGFADDLRLVPSSTGLHVSALAPGLTPSEVVGAVHRAAVAGVAVQPLSMFRAGETAARAGFVVGYGAIEVDDIDEALRRLRRVLRDG
jgi:GntR family transcriptional regulator/MocR family aminotransferase